MNEVVRLHEGRIALPPSEEEYAKWIGLEDASDFLRADLTLDDFALYSSVSDVFMHAALVPRDLLNPPDFADLMGWNFNPYRSGWGLVYSFNPPSVTIEPPLRSCGSNAISRGEQLLFLRDFEGYERKGTYVEILQKLLHVFSLHFIEERSAYCRLDKRGDLEDVVSINHIDDATGRHRGGMVVTIKRDVLDEYMAVTDTSVVRMFDFTRFRLESFGGWSNKGDEREQAEGDLYYRRHIEPGHGSYMRGVQIVPSRMSRDKAARNIEWGQPTDRMYESFIGVDRKNGGIVCEIATEPGKTANYFMDSPLPWEISPAFFRPEVLLRYKADTEKYSLRHRSITCRSAWSLQTFDINDAGQVHTYIAYLRDLPHDEQLHWKAHNEAPRAPMSERAITTDLRGERYRQRDELEGIRKTARDLNTKRPSWWVQRPERVIEKVFYVVTTSQDEWANEILNLEQATIEGFRARALRSHAERMGRSGIEKLASLKLIEECLMGLGWEEEPAREVTAPFHEVHDIRSHLRAHDGGSKAETIRRAVLKEHGTFVKHFRTLISRCDESMTTLANTLSTLA
jgi:hypothetical protein